jgi:hypothetical protein
MNLARRVRGRHILLTIMSVSLVLAGLSCPWAGSTPSAAAIALLAVSIFHANLVGLWVAFGNGWIRLAAAMAFSVAVSVFFAWIVSWEELIGFVVFFSGIVGVVGATGACLRWLFGELCQAGLFDRESDGLQFGLRHLFILTTIVAVAVATVQALHRTGLSLPGGVVPLIATLVALISLATVVQIWALFGHKLTLSRCVVVASIAVAASAGILLFRTHMVFWVVTIAVSQSLTVSALFCVRFEGYRFVKRQAIASQNATGGLEP